MQYNPHGQSEFMVIKSPQGWFVGYYQLEDDGNDRAMRMSGYYPCSSEANDMLLEVLQARREVA